MIWNQLSPELKFYVHLCLYMSFNSNSTSATSAAGTGNLPEHTQIEVGRFVYLNNRFKNTFVTAAMFSSNIVKNGVLYLLI
jgi:hypothetical protein